MIRNDIEVELHNTASLTNVSSKQTSIKFSDNYIQNFHLGRYFVGYTVRFFVLHKQIHKTISDHTNNHIPPQMKILNMLIPILTYL